MKGAAISFCLILALILSAVLSLPGGGLSATPAPEPGCHCCVEGSASARVASPCCHRNMPGPCGASCPSGLLTCHCNGGSLACLAPSPAHIPAWRVSSYCPAMVTVFAQSFPPNIFHPPELPSFSTPV